MYVQIQKIRKNKTVLLCGRSLLQESIVVAHMGLGSSVLSAVSDLTVLRVLLWRGSH